jgi:putative tricarboxylic transport membrane protein
MKNADRISALVILGICIAFFVLSRKFTQYGALFPQVIIILLGLLALLLLVLSFVKPKGGKVFDTLEVRYLPIGISVLLMVAWAFVINVLGFLVTSLLFFSLMAVYLGRKKTWLSILKNLAIVACVVTGFYFFFVKVLLVPFPEGILL